MGKVVSKAFRPMRNFNVENRAKKMIESDMPRPAPRHPSTVAAFDNIAQEYPEYLEEQKKKHPQLDEFLKQVRVNSTGDNPEIQSKSSRNLPDNRKKFEAAEYGFPDPDVIPEGKVSLRQALDFIGQHHLNPQQYTATSIASQYKLDPVQVHHILRHFQTLHLHIPKGMTEKNPKLLQSLDSNPAHRQSLGGMGEVTKLGEGTAVDQGPQVSK